MRSVRSMTPWRTRRRGIAATRRRRTRRWTIRRISRRSCVIPKQPLVYLPHSITEITGPQLDRTVQLKDSDRDLTIQSAGEPIGERIIVSGHVYDTEGKPLRDTLVEIWQANAAGRYDHKWDRWAAPLDPNFHGRGRA